MNTDHPEPVIRHLFISPGHNYRGHHGGPPGLHPSIEVPRIECVAGRGIVGDRYFDHKPDFKGQITFFSRENLVRLWEDLAVPQDRRDTSATRRNVIVENTDLNALIGREFEIQGVRFLGSEECKPCYWMNGAIHPEAEAWMRGRGGLRARILSDGWLRSETDVDGRRVSGALLAGGLSTRMGHDKATLEIAGAPLWQRQLDLLHSVCATVSVIAPERPRWLPDGRSFVPDSRSARGPMAGILAALEWARGQGGSHVFVLAVDMPRMMPQLLRKLAGACHPGQGVLPATGNLFEPLCAVYPVEALPVLSESAKQERWRLQDAVNELLASEMLIARSLLPEEKSMFFNLNSPNDLAVMSAP